MQEIRKEQSLWIWQCETCKKLGKNRVYEGESGDSGRKRGEEHERLWKAKDNKSVMHNHDTNEHNGIKAEYSMTVIQKYRSTFERQNNEPYRIKLNKPEESLNSKTEWNSQQTERLVKVDRYGNKSTNKYTHESRNTETMPVSTTNVVESENTHKKRAGRPKGSQNKKTIAKQ